MKREHNSEMIIPKEYEQIESIVCGDGGISYFQLQNYTDNISRITCDFILKSYNLDVIPRDSHIISGRENSSTGYKFFISVNNGHFFQINNSDSSSGGNSTVTNKECELDKRYFVDSTIFNGNITLKVDDTIVYSGIKNGVNHFKPFAFAFYAAGSTNNFDYFKGVCYGLNVYNNNNEIIEKYIPVKRKSDNCIGMFDVISSVFKQSIGTAQFK